MNVAIERVESLSDIEYNARVSRQAYLEPSESKSGGFSVDLASEERPRNAPEDPDDTHNNEVWPDDSEHVENRIESEREVVLKERFQRRSCYGKHISISDYR